MNSGGNGSNRCVVLSTFCTLSLMFPSNTIEASPLKLSRPRAYVPPAMYPLRICMAFMSLKCMPATSSNATTSQFPTKPVRSSDEDFFALAFSRPKRFAVVV